jgi:hypothetical protein
MWSERPDLVGVVDAWLAAARGGDAQAREHLRRLAAAPGLPQAVRARLP